MSKLNLVTIDGPSGVGKSTVSRRLAARLGYAYLDTGAMYRAVALKCKQQGVDIKSDGEVAPVLSSLNVQLLPAPFEGEDVEVLLDGVNISALIRTPELSMLASAVSALRSVRAKLTEMQREIGGGGNIVAEGRDMGTVVFPSASWKFYLDASPEERARRRIGQLKTKGEEVDEQEILAQIIQRDQDDQNRTIAPLKTAKDALIIDSTSESADMVIEKMLDYIKQN